MTDNEWHETEVRVRYKDTDRMGVVYYGNYLTFFEVGRTEFMRDLGFTYSNVEAEGYALVVTEVGAKYHANVDYDSLITVKSEITEMKKVSVRFEYEVLNENGILLVSGFTEHVCINSNRKITKIPTDLREAIKTRLKS